MNYQKILEVYNSIYLDITESHFKVGDEVICKASGMEGEVVEVDSEEKGKYYTVKREDGKTMKYAPNELKLESEEEEDDENKKEDVKGAKNGGASKKSETKFHTKLDKLVHNTFGASPEETKMKEDVDLFDYLLEYLVAEGYADTNQAALAIMANMGEEWKSNIIEQMYIESADSSADSKKSTWNKGQKLKDPRAQKVYDYMTKSNSDKK